MLSHFFNVMIPIAPPKPIHPIAKISCQGMDRNISGTEDIPAKAAVTTTQNNIIANVINIPNIPPIIRNTERKVPSPGIAPP